MLVTMATPKLRALCFVEICFASRQSSIFSIAKSDRKYENSLFFIHSLLRALCFVEICFDSRRSFIFSIAKSDRKYEKMRCSVS